MSIGKSEKLKDHISPLLSAMRDFSDQSVQRELEKILVPECQIKMCFPFETIKGTENYFGTAYKPLLKPFPNLESLRQNLLRSFKSSKFSQPAPIQSAFKPTNGQGTYVFLQGILAFWGAWSLGCKCCH